MKSKGKKTVRKPLRKDSNMTTTREAVREPATRDPALDKLSIKDLKDLRQRVDRAIASRQVDERNGLKDRFRELAEEAGFTLAEIMGGSGRASKGRVVAAKFANPANPMETWSGRGRQPKWLSAKLKAGESLEDFRL